MADKKSFLIHKDSLHVLDELTDIEAGKLFKAIALYQYGEEIELDTLTKITFAPFKSQFNRDNEKYLKTCEARAASGSKGGLAKASKAKQKLAKPSKHKQNLANLAESDNDNERDSESDRDNESDNGNDKNKVISLEFDRFWLAGMTKQSKQAALKAFTKQHKESKQEIIAFTDYLINDVQQRVAANVFGFDKMHPTTYLNQQRWHDDIVKPDQGGASKFDQNLDALQNFSTGQHMNINEINGFLTNE